MSRDKALSIIRDHGLYAAPVSHDAIALQDVHGTTYDTITITPDGQVSDNGETMPLMAWLGY